MPVVQEGAELLSCCDLCRIIMTEGRVIKHWQTQRCNKNTQIRWWIRYVVIANRCMEATFSLTREDGVENIEGVDVFKYWGRLLERSDDD